MNLSGLMNGSAAEVLSWMSALSEPTRVRLLRLLEHHELSVAEMSQVLRLPQSTTSRHLKHLADDGWLEPRPEGRNRYYRMQRARLSAEARRFWKLVRKQFDEDRAVVEDDARLEQLMQDRQSKSQSFFAATANEWEQLRSRLFGDGVPLCALAANLSGQSVLDLGCGTGELVEIAAPFAKRVLGVDQSAPMIRAAQKRTKSHGNAGLLRASLEELPLDDGSFDVAFMVLVLHHLPKPERALGECYRVLRPNARLIVLDMQAHAHEEYREEMGHAWLGFSPEELTALLTTVGFSNVNYTPLSQNPAVTGPALFAAIAHKPMLIPASKKPKRKEEAS